MDGIPFIFPVIDIKMTGAKIKKECKKQGLTVKQIQQFLRIGAFQSIYDWFNGKNLPSLDNMLALSCLLALPVERLIVCKEDWRGSISLPRPEWVLRRAAGYYGLLCRNMAG